MNDAKVGSWSESGVTRALGRVLLTLLGERAPLVISYDANSDRLWALESLSAKQWVGAAKNGVILVWDGLGSSGSYAGRVSLGEYVNPLTWGLCAVRRFKHTKLFVLDCDPRRNGKGRFYQVTQALSPAMLPFSLISGPGRCIAECISLLGDRQEAPGEETSIALLSHHLRAMLTERSAVGNRHALANFVGPLVLTGGNVVEDFGPGQKALASLFREMELIESAVRSALASPSASRSGTGSPKTSRQIREVRLLLVDDQWDCGWDRWVGSTLAFESSPKYFVENADSPDILVDALDTALGSIKSGSDCRFQLTFGRNDVETIVLLDLRLFSLRSLSDEATFVQSRVLPLCKRFSAERAQEHAYAWPGFSRKELRRAAEWCRKPERDTDTHLHVLGLLPRLLALADCSVPIVLFSSTGQRLIMDDLRPYGSIIPDFEKPRFTGLESADVVGETESRFRAAVAKARDLLAAREQCRRILLPDASDLGREEERSPDGPSPPAITRYVELFLDEENWVGTEFFSVGGCYAVFEARDVLSAREMADRFDDWLVQRGVRYFDNRGVGTSPPDLRKKRDDLAGFFADYQESEDAPIHLGLVRLRVRRDGEGIEKGPLFNPVNADNKFHLSLKALLELFFCESVPALAGPVPPENVMVSVFPGTRVVHILPLFQDSVMTKFGLKRMAETNLFYSLDRSQVYPVVADILDARGIKRETYRLCAVQLPYEGDRHVRWPEYYRCRRCSKIVSVSWDRRADLSAADLHCGCKVSDWQPDYRALHYVADEVLAQFPDGTGSRYHHIFFGESQTPGEFDEVMDGHLRASLSAGRFLDLGDLVRAVSEFEPSPAWDPAVQKPRSSHWLKRRLQPSLRTMHGDQFVRIARTLAERVYAPSQPPPRASDVAGAPSQGSSKQRGASVDALREGWRIKQYADLNAYLESGERWHQQGGFQVRQASTGRVTVFADLSEVGVPEPAGFVARFNPNLFRTDGSPGGSQVDFPDDRTGES